MKPERIWTGALLVLLIVVDAVLMVRISGLKAEVALKDQAIGGLSASRYLAECTTSNLNANYRYVGTPVGFCGIDDARGNRRRLGEVIRRPTLVFRYCDRACGECVAFAADKLTRDSICGCVPVVFLARYDNEFEMRKAGPGINPSGFSMFNAEKMLEMDETLVPYYCIVDEHGMVRDIFIPEKTAPSTTSRYLARMRQKYGSL